MHIYRYGSEEWDSNLLFRDYLRNHPDVRQQYGQLKKELANKHYFDRVTYTNAKAPFITNIIQKAKLSNYKENCLFFVDFFYF